MITVENLTKSFKDLQVLKGISTTINKGDVVCVIGPSGGGKSTFLRCLNLLEKPTGGKIIFEGDDLTDKKVDLNRHRQKMGMVFQQFNLFPHMSVLKNLTIAPMMLKKMSREDAEAKALQLLEDMNVDGLLVAYDGTTWQAGDLAQRYQLEWKK